MVQRRTPEEEEEDTEEDPFRPPSVIGCECRVLLTIVRRTNPSDPASGVVWQELSTPFPCVRQSTLSTPNIFVV